MRPTKLPKIVVDTEAPSMKTPKDDTLLLPNGDTIRRTTVDGIRLRLPGVLIDHGGMSRAIDTDTVEEAVALRERLADEWISGEREKADC